MTINGTAGDGFVVWFTGPSGGRAKALAAAVQAELAARGHRVEALHDADVRGHLARGQQPPPDEETMVSWTGYVAAKLAGHGVAVLAVSTSPSRGARARVRGMVADFVEVAVVSPPEDGLAGFEPPATPEVTVQAEREPVEDSARRVVEALEARGLVQPEQVYSASEEDEIAARLEALGYLD